MTLGAVTTSSGKLFQTVTTLSEKKEDLNINMTVAQKIFLLMSLFYLKLLSCTGCVALWSILFTGQTGAHMLTIAFFLFFVQIVITITQY